LRRKSYPGPPPLCAAHSLRFELHTRIQVFFVVPVDVAVDWSILRLRTVLPARTSRRRRESRPARRRPSAGTSGFCLAQRSSNREQPDTTLVFRCCRPTGMVAAIECDRGEWRGGGVAPIPGSRASLPLVVPKQSRHTRSNRHSHAIQIASARIIAEPGPHPQQLFERWRGRSPPSPPTLRQKCPRNMGRKDPPF